VVAYCAQDPEHLIPFLSLDPTQDGWQDELEQGHQDLKHLDKLAEDEDAMIAFDRFGDQFLECLDFDGGLLIFQIRKTEEPKITAGLTES